MICLVTILILGFIATSHATYPTGDSFIFNCANGCTFNETTRQCQSSDPAVMCNPTTSPNCPYGCVFNDTDHVCIDLIDVDPTYTYYTPYTDSQCWNSNDQCTCKCKFNTPTNSCIPQSNSEYCNKQSHWYCPRGCGYVQGYGRCIRTTYPGYCSAETAHSTRNCRPTYSTCGATSYTCNDVCSNGGSCWDDPTNDDRRLTCYPTTRATCPRGYAHYLPIPSCTDTNRNDFCSLNAGTFQYPDWLDSEGDMYRCNYFEPHPCEEMNLTILTCPPQCHLDDLRNKCLPSYRNIICGSFQLEPSLNLNGSLACPDPTTQMLLNITNSSGQKNVWCGPTWYYLYQGLSYTVSGANHVMSMNLLLWFVLMFRYLF